MGLTILDVCSYARRPGTIFRGACRRGSVRLLKTACRGLPGMALTRRAIFASKRVCKGQNAASTAAVC